MQTLSSWENIGTQDLSDLSVSGRAMYKNEIKEQIPQPSIRTPPIKKGAYKYATFEESTTLAFLSTVARATVVTAKTSLFLYSLTCLASRNVGNIRERDKNMAK